MTSKRPRPEQLDGCTMRMPTGCGNMYVTINEDGVGKPVEVFCRLGKAGGCASSQTEALGRLITLALQFGTPITDIINELRGISCHQPQLGKKKILSCADAVSQILLGYMEPKGDVEEEPKKAHPIVPPEKKPAAPVEEEEEIPHIDHNKIIKEVHAIARKEAEKASRGGACPDCGGTIAHEDGCMVCRSCGWTKC